VGGMSEPFPLDLERLRRRPDVEDPTLQAHDATDVLLVQRGLEHARAHGLRGEQILIVGERHGAITLALAAAGLRGMLVHQDRLAHERALDRNADELGLAGSYGRLERVGDGAAGARLLLWQLPRQVGAVRRTVAELAAVPSGALLLAGGRVKHLSVGMNAPLAEGFGDVEPQLAERKSRLLLVHRDAERSLAVPPGGSASVTVGGQRLELRGEAESFGGAALDPGTRLLLDTLAARGTAAGNDPATVVDLGCGNGTIAAWAALTWPGARIEATDDSRDAVAAAAASLEASGVARRARVVRADGGDHLSEGAADVVLLNPPFHQGGTVHTGIATKLMREAARMLRPGGTLLCVWNSHLRYRPRLERLVGPTEQLARDRTFTVTASTRRG
jgi:16S rRNA (guanine1207-N2)-methyltransferase